MDGLTLLAEASAAGLTVEAVGDRLVVGGPKRAASLAQRLLDQKPAVMKVLQVPAGQQPVPEPAVEVPVTSLATTTEITAEPLGADSWPVEAVEPGEPCPKCGGLLWWEDLEDGRHCLSCERAGWERSEEVAARARRLRARSGLPPWGFVFHPAECPRCRSTGFLDVPIHNGQSVRRDCARCGRFIVFVVWYGRVLQPSGN
jgi:hypothetical protein